MPLFYNENVKILYLHVPKTAGTSVEKFFENNGFRTGLLDRTIGKTSMNFVRFCSPQHYEAQTLRQIVNLNHINYIFVTVREPVARILSEYRMLFRGFENPPEINSWIRTTLREYAQNNYLYDNHIRPQHEFLIRGCDIFKLENGLGDRWIDTLSRKTGITFHNRNIEHPPPSTAAAPRLDPDVLERLANFYANDFSMLGYKLPVSEQGAMRTG